LKVAIGGKGGSGKTTIAATLARSLARRGYPVTAVDGDPNPNLGAALGMSKEQLGGLARVPKEIVEMKEEEGRNRLVLTRPVEEISAEYGVDAPDGVRLMTMTGVDHAGAG
jgi:CO dehydrogenase maturation factor